jgi:hypothetical protein
MLRVLEKYVGIVLRSIDFDVFNFGIKLIEYPF